MYSDTLLIVRWTNLHNGDSGYVKSLHRQERYFESTHVVEEAKVFSARGIKQMLYLLRSYNAENAYSTEPLGY